FVYKPAELFYAAFSPRPHLRADVVNNRNSGISYPLAESQIEIGKVYENGSSRRIRFHSLCKPAENPIKDRERTDHLEGPDDGCFADIPFKLNASLAHALSAETIYPAIREPVEKPFRHVRAVHIPRRFSGDDQKPIRTHGTRFFNSRK